MAPHGFLVWQDALLLDHLALAKNISDEIKNLGGVILRNANIENLERNEAGISVSCGSISNARFSVNAKYAVNCLGSAYQQIEKEAQTQWCLAFNVVLKRQFSIDTAFGCDGEEGRYFFFVPRGS